LDKDDVTDDWEDVDEEAPGFWCVDRWHNAGPKEWKKMFVLFQESEIFIASCRHRLVLLACDMIRSGELYIINLSIYIFLIESSVGQNMCL
jgi:hypothetical protein